ncbi:hypothetical protein DSECCO2_28740 [anaerobic digester metagenome]
MVYAGPIILGFLLGFILGTRIKENPESKLKFDTSVYMVTLIFAVAMAYFLGAFPYYTDVPFASGFLAAFIGIIVGKLLFGRGRSIENED